MKTFTILLFSFTCFLSADKIEIKDISNKIVYEIRRNGQQIELHFDSKMLTCSNRKGNRGYRDSKLKEVYRVSRKADHITVYDGKYKMLYRLAIKANRFTLTNTKGMVGDIKIKNNQATVYDSKYKHLGKVEFASGKNKIEPNGTAVLSYKTASAQFGGAFLMFKEVPKDIQLILFNEFIDK